MQLVALPEVLEAVKGSNIEVYLDGEIRCGADALKALALGARAVFIGRPVLWALAVSVSSRLTVQNESVLRWIIIYSQIGARKGSFSCTSPPPLYQ